MRKAEPEEMFWTLTPQGLYCSSWFLPVCGLPTWQSQKFLKLYVHFFSVHSRYSNNIILFNVFSS